MLFFYNKLLSVIFSANVFSVSFFANDIIQEIYSFDPLQKQTSHPVIKFGKSDNKQRFADTEIPIAKLVKFTKLQTINCLHRYSRPVMYQTVDIYDGI